MDVGTGSEGKIFRFSFFCFLLLLMMNSSWSSSRFFASLLDSLVNIMHRLDLVLGVVEVEDGTSLAALGSRRS